MSLAQLLRLRGLGSPFLPGQCSKIPFLVTFGHELYVLTLISALWRTDLGLCQSELGPSKACKQMLKDSSISL